MTNFIKRHESSGKAGEHSNSATASMDRLPSELEAVIAAFVDALAAWYAASVDGQLPDNGPELDAYNATAEAFILFQCATHADVQRKLQFVATCSDMQGEIEGCEWFEDFNASLIIPSPVATAVIDPLLIAIREYRSACDEFNRLCDADDSDSRWDEHEAATFGPKFARLKAWSEPARSMEGAIEALRASMTEERGVFGSEAEGNIRAAALAYFQQAAAAMGETFTVQKNGEDA